MAKPKKGLRIVSDEVCHARSHLLVELVGASRLDSIKQIEKAITAAVRAIKATLLRVHPHHFFPNKVITGSAILFGFFIPPSQETTDFSLSGSINICPPEIF